jgi:hypothetical protein
MKKLGSRPADGVPVVTLHNGRGSSERLPVAPLICRAFHGEAPEGKTHVVHVDGRSKNNQQGNLRWGTASEIVEATWARGKKKAVARILEPREVDAIREQWGEESAASLGERYGVSAQTVRDIWSRRTHAEDDREIG